MRKEIEEFVKFISAKSTEIDIEIYQAKDGSSVPTEIKFFINDDFVFSISYDEARILPFINIHFKNGENFKKFLSFLKEEGGKDENSF